MHLKLAVTERARRLLIRTEQTLLVFSPYLPTRDIWMEDSSTSKEANGRIAWVDSAETSSESGTFGHLT